MTEKRKGYSTERIGQFVDAHELFVRNLNGEREQPLQKERISAIQRFRDLGIPTTRNEEWKYTNVAPIEKTEFQLASDRPAISLSEEELSRHIVDDLDGWRMTFVNGRFDREHSEVEGLPEGVTLLPLSEAIESQSELIDKHLIGYGEDFEHSFATLNRAHLKEGVFLHVPKNVSVDRPIHLLFVSATEGKPLAAHPRILVIVEESAAVTVLEEYSGHAGDTYLNNVVAEYAVADNAQVERLVLQKESRHAFHINAAHIRIGRNANAYTNTLTFGGAIVRNDPWAVLNGEGSHAAIDGMYVADNDEHVDNHTVIDHRVPNCTSHELYKGVLDGTGHGVFNGKVFVRQDAQKTDSLQSNNTLLLSDSAVIDTKPQLEIFADDVKCTHGATVGQLDAQMIYYLRARGIGRDKAERMLTYAFAAEVIDHIRHDDIRVYAESLLENRLGK